MGQAVLQTFALPDDPLDAAAHFYANDVPLVREILQDGGPKHGPEGEPAAEFDAVVFVFPLAGKEHYGWRLAAVQALAREAAPKRVNGVVGSHQRNIDEVIEWLASAPGITGQLLAVDGKPFKID